MDCVACKNLATFPRKRGSPASATSGHRPQDHWHVAAGPHCYWESKHPSCWLATWHPPGSRLKSSRWHSKSHYRNKKLFYFFLKLIRFPETITKWSLVPLGANTSFPDAVPQGSAAVGVTCTVGSYKHRGHAPAIALAGHRQTWGLLVLGIVCIYYIDKKEWIKKQLGLGWRTFSQTSPGPGKPL